MPGGCNSRGALTSLCGMESTTIGRGTNHDEALRLRGAHGATRRAQHIPSTGRAGDAPRPGRTARMACTARMMGTKHRSHMVCTARMMSTKHRSRTPYTLCAPCARRAPRAPCAPCAMSAPCACTHSARGQCGAGSAGLARGVGSAHRARRASRARRAPPQRH